MAVTVNTTIKTIRAVGTEFAWRLLKPMIILGSILAAVLLFVGGWLTTKDALWWILEFIFITSTIMFIVLCVITFSVINRLKPDQTKNQKKAVNDFADKLQRVADTIGIARFVLLFRIVRDVMRPTERPFIKQIADDSTTLHTDFIKLQKQFEDGA